MADQGKWFKLHCGWDDDPHIDSLSLEDQARWVKFGTYMKEHGTEGTVTLVDPCRVLQNKFRLSSFEAVLNALKTYPNIRVEEKQKSTVSGETVTTVSFLNWHRYQADLSSERVRKFRARETAKKRGEEKRGEEKRKRREESISPIPPKVFSKPTAEEVTAYAKTVGFNLNGGRFCDYYESKGWKIGKSPMKDWKATVRTWKSNDTGESNGTHDSPSPVSYAAIARATREAENLRTVTPPRSISDGSGSLPPLQDAPEPSLVRGHRST